MHFCEDLGEHTVLRHGQRQPGVAHDQRVEHPEGADHPAQYQPMRSNGPPTILAISAQEPVSHTLGARPVIHMAPTGTM